MQNLQCSLTAISQKVTAELSSSCQAQPGRMADLSHRGGHGASIKLLQKDVLRCILRVVYGAKAPCLHVFYLGVWTLLRVAGLPAWRRSRQRLRHQIVYILHSTVEASREVSTQCFENGVPSAPPCNNRRGACAFLEKRPHQRAIVSRGSDHERTQQATRAHLACISNTIT